MVFLASIQSPVWPKFLLDHFCHVRSLQQPVRYLYSHQVPYRQPSTRGSGQSYTSWMFSGPHSLVFCDTFRSRLPTFHWSRTWGFYLALGHQSICRGCALKNHFSDPTLQLVWKASRFQGTVQPKIFVSDPLFVIPEEMPISQSFSHATFFVCQWR